MPRGTNLEYTRGYNRRIVLETIRRHGPISRSDIASGTFLAFQTVANIINELLEMGLVVTGERRQGKRGSPSLDIQINPEGAYSIGVNFDRDRLTGALVDLSGTVLDQVQYELDEPRPQAVLPLMEEVIGRLLARVEPSKVLGVAIGVPGPLHVEEREGLMPDDLSDWLDISITGGVEERFGVRTFVERNANAAAIGEYWYGAGREFNSFFYIYVGIGLGSAVIADGGLFHGGSRLAGKIGYVPVVAPEAGNGDAMRLKDAFSFASLKRHLAANGLRDVRPESLEVLLGQRSEPLLGWLDEAAAALAPALLFVECILDPPAILFGGRIPSSLMNEVLERVDKRLELLRPPEKRTIHPRLLCAQASENVAAMGVATVPLYELLAPDHSLLLKEQTGAGGRWNLGIRAQ